jgi:hypothetical protein
MKTAFSIVLTALTLPNALAAPGLQKLPGTYVSDEGKQFVLSVSGRTATLRTNAELSRYDLCRSPVTLTTASLDSDDDYAEARFEMGRGICDRVDGPVTFHYNKALTGVDVYLVDVVIREGHGRDRGQTMRWHLRKVN